MIVPGHIQTTHILVGKNLEGAKWDCVLCRMRARHEEWIVEGKGCGYMAILELAEMIQTWDDGVIWCGVLTVGTMKGSWVGIYLGNRIFRMV